MFSILHAIRQNSDDQQKTYGKRQAGDLEDFTNDDIDTNADDIDNGGENIDPDTDFNYNGTENDNPETDDIETGGENYYPETDDIESYDTVNPGTLDDSEMGYTMTVMSNSGEYKSRDFSTFASGFICSTYEVLEAVVIGDKMGDYLKGVDNYPDVDEETIINLLSQNIDQVSYSLVQLPGDWSYTDSAAYCTQRNQKIAMILSAEQNKRVS